MPAVKLDDKKVKHWAPSEKRQEVPDSEAKGLYLIVQPSKKGPDGSERGGSKSWAVRYRWGGKVQKLTIGPYPTYSLADAREQAKEAVRMATRVDMDNEGKPLARDPREVQRERKRRPEDSSHYPRIVERFLKPYRDGRASPRQKNRKPRASTFLETARLLGLKPDKHKAGGWHTIKGSLADIWGQKPIQDIAKADVMKQLDALADEGMSYAANRTYTALSMLFTWAVHRDLIPASPVIWIKAAEEARERALSSDEIRWFWRATGEPGWPFGPMFRLLLLTGQRRNEVAHMTWSEVDLDAALWTIPKERTKNGQEHVVPLSGEAITLLQSALAEDVQKIAGRADFVFTTNGRTPASGYSRAKANVHAAMERLAAEEHGKPMSIPEWRLHDLRRTVSTKMNDELGIDPHIVEAVLNHISGSRAGVAGTYNRAAYLKPKKAALEAWGGWLTEKPVNNVRRLQAV